MLRPGLEIDDGKYVNQSFIGYGGHFGIDVKPGWLGWVKDDIITQFVVGFGDRRLPQRSQQLRLWRPTTRHAVPTTPAAAALVRTAATTEMGWEIGYQHWWLDNLRSRRQCCGWNFHDVHNNLVGLFGGVEPQPRDGDRARQSDLEPGVVGRSRPRVHVRLPRGVANIRGTEQALIGMFRVKFEATRQQIGMTAI